MSLFESNREGEKAPYPGLVKPYSRREGEQGFTRVDKRCSRSINIASSSTGHGMNETSRELLSPFSVYDDKEGVDFVYVPAKSSHLTDRNRTPVHTNDHLRNIMNRSSRKEAIKDRTTTFPPYGSTTTNQPPLRSVSDVGEYCYISTSGKNNNNGTNLRLNKSCGGFQKPFSSSKEMESLRDFAQKFAVSETSEVQDAASVHSFYDRSKINTSIEISGIYGSDSRISKHCRTKADDAIEFCTCIFCLKGLCYHCVDDGDEDMVVDPCSCAGSKSKVFGRWLCMGVLSFLFPCLCCYLPARGCLKLCRTCKSSKKRDELLGHQSRPPKVKYSKEHCPKQKPASL